MSCEAQSGGCLCGAVRFKAIPKAKHIDACHCGMCRRQVGGPMMAVDCSSLAVDDEMSLGVYESSAWAERCFCKACGTNLFFRVKDGSFVSVNAGAFDDLSDFEFTLEIFIDEKPGYYDFKQDTRKMTGAEVFAAFGVS